MRFVLGVLVVLAVSVPRDGLATDHGHGVALTISPFHLVAPIIEVTGEFAVNRNLGVAAVGGYGQLTYEDPQTGAQDPIMVYEAGLQGRWYALGSFDHGLQLGGEALFVAASGKDVGADEVDATGAGFGVGPFIGYKKAARFGLTFDAQLGFQYTVLRAEASNGSASKRSDVTPMLNLNLGWSF